MTQYEISAVYPRASASSSDNWVSSSGGLFGDTAILSDPSNPASATVMREQTAVNGATWDTTVDLASRTRTTISPEGRVHRETTDASGRPVLIERAAAARCR